MYENKEGLKKGTPFQIFVNDIIINKFMDIQSELFIVAEEQYKGETTAGIEIKNDDVYINTGNIYIEIKEKSKSTNYYWVSSGILKNDNSTFIAIGNYHEIFILNKYRLKNLYIHYSGNSYKTEWYELKYREIPTSKGFTFQKIRNIDNFYEKYFFNDIEIYNQVVHDKITLKYSKRNNTIKIASELYPEKIFNFKEVFSKYLNNEYFINEFERYE